MTIAFWILFGIMYVVVAVLLWFVQQFGAGMWGSPSDGEQAEAVLVSIFWLPLLVVALLYLAGRGIYRLVRR